MWDTKKWLLRSLLLTLALSSIFLVFQHKAREQAELRYQQNMEYVQKEEAKRLKKGKKKQPQVSAASLVNTKKPEYFEWYFVVFGVAVHALVLSAIVQKWGWAPIVTTFLYLTVVGIVLIFVMAKMESNQRNRYG